MLLARSKAHMPDQQYEYSVEPTSISPSELRNAQYKIEDILNNYAADGWVLDDTLAIDVSSLLLIFRRTIDQ